METKLNRAQTPDAIASALAAGVANALEVGPGASVSMSAQRFRDLLRDAAQRGMEVGEDVISGRLPPQNIRQSVKRKRHVLARPSRFKGWLKLWLAGTVTWFAVIFTSAALRATWLEDARGNEFEIVALGMPVLVPLIALSVCWGLRDFRRTAELEKSERDRLAKRRF